MSKYFSNKKLALDGIDFVIENLKDNVLISTLSHVKRCINSIDGGE